MRYAVINDATGVVENIVILEDPAAWAPPDGFSIRAHDEVDIGWSVKQDVLTPPPAAVVALGIIPAAPLPPTKAEMLLYAAQKRWRVETGGLTLSDGTKVPTDQSAQTRIAAAKQAFDNGTLTAPIAFKAASGWITVDAGAMTAIYVAMVGHIEAGYAAEKAVGDGIASGSITGYADIETANWPTN